MAKFTNKDRGLGFDSSIPWQMVPLGGARGILLHDGANLDIEIWRREWFEFQTSGLTYTETKLWGAKHREIWLQGREEGSYVVKATGPGYQDVRASLYVDVLKERVVNVAYYFVADSKHRAATRWDARELHDLANDLLFRQANIRLNFLGSFGSEFGEKAADLGDNINPWAEKTRNALRAFGNHAAAQVLVYFVWRIADSSKGAGDNGQRVADQILIDSYKRKPTEKARMARTLAHEIGHFLSDSNGPLHDDSTTELMYDNNAPNPGTNLRRKRILRFIRE